MGSLVSQLTIRLIDGVTSPARQVASSLRGVGAAAKALNGSGGFAGAQQRLNRAIERNGAAIAELNGKMLAATGTVIGLGVALKSVVSPAIKLESAVADLRKVADFDDTGLARFVRDARRIAPDLAMTTESYIKLAESGAAAGVGAADLMGYTTLAAKVAVAWGTGVDRSAESLAKLRTALKLTNDQLERFSDVANVLSDATAASAPDIIEFARRTAPSARIAGLSDRGNLALGATMMSAGVEPDVASTSMMNMSRALGAGSGATKRQRAAYASIGMKPEVVARRMQKEGDKVIVEVLDKLSKLPAHQRLTTMTDLFGAEARGAPLLLENLDQLRANLALVNDETRVAGSVQKEFAVRSKTTETAIDRLTSSLDTLAGQVGSAFLPAIRQAADAIGPMARGLGDWAEQNPKLIVGAAGLAGGLIGLKIGAIGLALAARFALGGLLILAKPLVAIVGALGRAGKAASGAIALQRALAAMGGVRMGFFSTLATGLRGIAQALPLIGGIAAGISAPVVGLVAALAAGGFLLWKYWDQVSSVFSGVAKRLGEELAPAFQRIQPIIQPVLDWLGGIGTWLGEKLGGLGSLLGSIFSPEKLGASDRAAWEKWGFDLADGAVQGFKNALNGLVDWCAGLWGRVKAVFTSIDLGSLIRWPSMPWSGGGGSTSPPAPAQPAAPSTMPGRASGGIVGRGRSYLVGERGRPEIFTPREDGHVFRPEDLARHGAPAPATGTVTFSATVNITAGNVTDPHELARVVRRGLRDEFAALMRGAHADLNLA